MMIAKVKSFQDCFCVNLQKRIIGPVLLEKMNKHFFPVEDFMIFKIFGYSFTFIKLRQAKLLQGFRSRKYITMFSTMENSYYH